MPSRMHNSLLAVRSVSSSGMPALRLVKRAFGLIHIHFCNLADAKLRLLVISSTLAWMFAVVGDIILIRCSVVRYVT